MTLLEAIQACAAFTHALPGHIHGELRGQRVLDGIQLDATDGKNAIRVLVPRDSLAPSYACLPPQWALTHAEARSLSDVGQLTLAKAESSDSANFDDCSSQTAKVGKSGKPGKAKPGPVFRAFHDQSDQGRKWSTFDNALADIRRKLTPRAWVKTSELTAALEPLDGAAEALFDAQGSELRLTAGPWTTSLGKLFTAPNDTCPRSLPIRILVAPLWTALEAMNGDTVCLSWAELPEDSTLSALGYREGGPMLAECGGVSFLTMPASERYLPPTD